MSLPDLAEVMSNARVVALPLRTKFRGITTREAVILEGPQGLTEFSPFIEYDDEESATWLAGAYDFGWAEPAPVLRRSIAVNATLPAVAPDDIETVLAHYDGCRTIKIKVAEPGQSLADDVARVARVREMRPDARLRVDANAGWSLTEATAAVEALVGFDLEYVEQPCASIEELAELRGRFSGAGVLIAADESVRKAADPLAVARAGAADVLVIKAQPLGGVHRALEIIAQAGLPAVVSSALDTSVGIAMGLALAAALPAHPYDAGLATAALLEADVTTHPLVPVAGSIKLHRPEIDDELCERYAANAERRDWWLQRVERCHSVLTAAAS